MKKNLIALAVAGAVAAPMAAQADATIYGVMDVEVANLDDGANSGLYVMSRNSRIGFKGAEDLGNGMKAIWQIENDMDRSQNGIGPSTATPDKQGWATRNTFVGLAGNFGAVILGKHDTPYKIVGRKVDLFGHHLGDARSITNWDGNNGFYGATAATGHDLRVDNVVAYKSPNMGGFGILAAIVTNDRTGDNKGIGAYSISGTYNKGPLFVGLAYQNIDAKYFTPQAPNNPKGKNTGLRVSAAYKMGAFKIVGLYQDAKNDITNAATSVQAVKTRVYGLGGSFKTGAHTIKAQYYAGEQKDRTVAGSKAKANLLAVGYDYSLSKKTTLYVEYAQVKNNDDNANNVAAGRSLYGGAGLVPYGTGVGQKTDATSSGFGAGLRIKF